MAEALIPRRTINKQEYVLLADVTVGTATTNVDITGLNIGKDEEIVLVSDIVNGTSSSVRVGIYINGNNTATNYYSQRIVASGSGVLFATRDNSPFYLDFDGNNKSLSYASVKLTNNGYFTSQSNVSREYGGSAIVFSNNYITSTFTATSITSFRINANATNGIGIGSRFKLYRSAK